MPRLVLVLSIFLLAGACSQSAATGDIPARIKTPSLAGQAEIQAHIRQALGSINVSINRDVFANSSFLNLEHPTFRDGGGNRVTGRTLGTPVQFRLYINGRDCVLVYPDTDQRWILNESECEVE